jgi:hypothetical protein
MATWASFVMRALPIFILPLLISIHMDSVLLAFWLVLITLQGLQLLFESGFTASFMRGFSYAMGGADRLRIEVGPPTASGQPPNHALLARTWNMGSVLYLGVALITGIVLMLFGGWSGTNLMVQLPSGEQPWGALAVFAVGAALRSYGGLQLSYLYGVNRIALVRWWEAAFCLLAFLAAAVTILAGGGLLALAIAYQIPLAANVFWNMWLCRRDQAARPGFIRGFRADADILAQLWPGVWRTGLGTLLYLGTTQGAGLYYATVGNPADVAAFLFAMSLLRPLGQFAQVPFFTKVPTLARLQASGARLEQRAIAERAMRASYVLHMVMVLGVAVSLPLVAGMVEGGLQVPLLLWLLIGLSGYVERIGAMHIQLYSSTNHILIHWANGLAALVFVALSAVLLPRIGVYAFPVANILALVLGFLPIAMINSYRAFTLPFPKFELKTSVGPLIILIVLLLLISSLML